MPIYQLQFTPNPRNTHASFGKTRPNIPLQVTSMIVSLPLEKIRKLLLHLLINPVDPHLVHQMHPRLHLGVFHISSNVTRQKAFLHKLPVYSSQPLVAPHVKHMNQAGGAGAAGGLQGNLILFQHL